MNVVRDHHCRIIHIGSYGWDSLTKVIACAARVMCAKELVIERYYFFILLQILGLLFGDDGTGLAD